MIASNASCALQTQEHCSNTKVAREPVPAGPLPGADVGAIHVSLSLAEARGVVTSRAIASSCRSTGVRCSGQEAQGSAVHRRAHELAVASAIGARGRPSAARRGRLRNLAARRRPSAPRRWIGASSS